MIYLKRSKFLDVTNELFLFIFVISAVQSVHIKFWRWLDSNRGPVVLEETAVPTQPLSLPQKCDNLIRDNNLLRVNNHLLGKQVHQHTRAVAGGGPVVSENTSNSNNPVRIPTESSSLFFQ